MKKYAVVVGISSYRDPDISDLHFAANDAAETGRCLRDICGFDDVRLFVTGGANEPDNTAIIQALVNLAPLQSEDDLFLFYFAGHAIHTGGESYLFTQDSMAQMPDVSSLSMRVLKNCFSRFDAANRILILDACRNDPQHGRGDGDNLLTQNFSRDILAVANSPCEGVTPTTCILHSCSVGQRAHEWPDQGHGAFTYYLLEGMRGEAYDEKGRLTVQGLGRYVESQVPRWSKKYGTFRPQVPWSEQKGSLRDICLAIRDQGRPVRQSKPPGPEAKEIVPEDIKATVFEAPKRKASHASRVDGGPGRDLTNSFGMTFVYIWPGSFDMGTPESEDGHGNDERLHRVILSEGYWLQATPVTQAQWKAVMGSNPSRFSDFDDSGDRPVEWVSWADIEEFARLMTQTEGRAYRLPTEAEWEYAARAGSTTRYCFGDDESRLGDYAWYEAGFGGNTRPVGQKLPNEWGLYDMHGNVCEWCRDWYGDYSMDTVTDPAGPASGTRRVLRGGSWRSRAQECRSGYRSFRYPFYRYYSAGFRLVIIPGS